MAEIRVEIPYGAYWSTPFAKWQGSLGHLHSVRFAAWVATRALKTRAIDPAVFDYGLLGLTVPQASSFYGLPWLMGLIGTDAVAGPTINQACATGARLVASAVDEIRAGRAACALAISGDRTSNGPQIYYPNPRGPGGSGEHEAWILDNFERDPLAGCAMVDTAENVARRCGGIETAEQHDLVLRRFAQYGDALAEDRAFQRRYMDLPFEVPDERLARVAGTLEGDEGVQVADPARMARLRPVRADGTVTYAGQTHPADGSAGIVVTTPEKAAELSRDRSIRITLLSFGQSREERGYMPAAPIKAAAAALGQAGLRIGEMAAIKSHNPFAVNDIAFARAFGIQAGAMNNFGCSLVWGHPQGPTGLRSVIELIEELARGGGGYGLFQGCAAGDSAMAVVLRVDDRPAGTA